MNIGITVYPTYGGSGIVGSELGKELAARGHAVHFIASALPTRLTELSERVRFHEVEMMSYPLFEHQPYTLALATKMATVAEEENLDLLHVHYAIPHSISAILARESLKPRRRLPVVTTLHGTDITLVGNDPSFMETTRWGIDQSDAVTTVSASLRNATRDIFGITRPIEVVPNFIDPHRYLRTAAGPGARRWAKPGEKILVHISNFRPVKRVDDVVEVFHRLRGRFPVRLLMVGDGPERARVEQRCRQHGSCGEVSFIGNLPLVEEVLVNADLFLLPSESESFGLAALEALACKVPVIATRAGGIPEVIADGECGLLYPVGDVEGMAEGAARLLADEPLRQSFGEAGRERAVERFGTTKVVAQYRALYESVLAPV